MSIPADIIDAVRQKASLVELTSDLPKFKRSGRGFSACCPFHEDSSPSFSINDEEGLYYCFGCGKKGSIFDYVMETRNLTFPEAVKFLANRVGIDVPERAMSKQEQEQEKHEQQKKTALREFLNAAIFVYEDYFHNDPGAEAAREYIRSRGLSKETISKFRIGYAPQSWDFVANRVWDALGKKRLSGFHEMLPHLFDLGLIKRKAGVGVEKSAEAEAGEVDSTGTADEKRTYYDAFRARVIFPILRSDGAPIALGGRIMVKAPDMPKYINSPESSIYYKRRTFYGISQAVEAIRKARHAFMVEGYLDVISMHQRGLLDVVATCGTAITPDHAQILRRMVNRVTAMFDGDLAGRKAAANCFPIFLNSGIEVSAVILPEDEDPDSFARAHSKEEIESYVAEKRVPIIDVYLDHILAQLGESGPVNSAVIGGKAALEFVRAILPVNNAVEREFLMKRACDRFGVTLQAMSSLFTGEAKAAGAIKETQKAPYRPVKVKAAAERFKNEFLAPPQDSDIPPPPEETYYESGFEHEVSAPPKANAAYKRNSKPVASRVAYLNTYWRQLVVALICEPKLSASVLEMPSLLEGAVVAESLPNRVRAFVEELKVSGLPSVAGMEHNRSALQRLRALLEKHDFDANDLINEALRQSQIGGMEPKKIVQDTQLTTARTSLRGTLEQLRDQEAQSNDQMNRARLLQEKLRTKRKLEEITNMDRPSTSKTK